MDPSCLKGDSTFWETGEISNKTPTEHISMVSSFGNSQDFIIKFRFLSRSNMYRSLKTYELHTFEEHISHEALQRFGYNYLLSILRVLQGKIEKINFPERFRDFFVSISPPGL